MRIAIDVRSLMEGRHSGVEEYTTHIINALIRNAPQHSYHLFYNSAKPVTLPSFGEGRVAIHARRIPNKLLNASQLTLGWPRMDTLLRLPVDVILVPNPRPIPVSPHIPVVLVVHDVSFELFPEFLTLRRRLWHRFMRPQILARNADHIIAVSEHTKQDLVDLYDMPTENIATIHSGLSQQGEVQATQVQQVRQKYALPERFVLYLGTLEPRKNVAGLIEAWSAIAGNVEQDLVIAGESGWRMQEVERAYMASPYKHRIHRIGFIPQQYKQALYAAADTFIYPSFYEGFGFPPLEALAAGTPAITSFNSSLPEVVGQWATLVDPHNTPQLAAVMQELLQKPERVPHEVRQLIRDTYTWDSAAQKTLQVLESVV